MSEMKGWEIDRDIALALGWRDVWEHPNGLMELCGRAPDSNRVACIPQWHKAASIAVALCMEIADRNNYTLVLTTIREGWYKAEFRMIAFQATGDLLVLRAGPWCDGDSIADACARLAATVLEAEAAGNKIAH